MNEVVPVCVILSNVFEHITALNHAAVVIDIEEAGIATRVCYAHFVGSFSHLTESIIGLVGRIVDAFFNGIKDSSTGVSYNN